MSQEPEIEQQRIASRLVEMENRYLHIERTLGDLDQVVLDQQRQIDALHRQVERLKGELKGLAGSMPDERDPAQEKPPHY